MSTAPFIPASTPEAQGIPSSALLTFVRAVHEHFAGLSPVRGLHSLILVRHGHRVAQGWWSPYAPEHPHELFSLTKSFTSTAVGLAVAEGRLSVEDPVFEFFPDDAPPNPGPHLTGVRVRHLLTMTVGHTEEPSGAMMERRDGNWARGFLAHPVPHAPGTHFLYNSAASYMLSAIVHKLTGRSTLDYLVPRLFSPLGIDRPDWITCPRGVNIGGWGLSLKTEGIARFGLLLMQRGMWHGRRLLPEAWVTAATSRQVDNSPSDNPDWEQGYGYQFWRCRHDAVRGDGAFGQYCILMPDQDAVLAITSGVQDMQAVLDLVWEHLLPAMGPTALKAEPGAQAELEKLLANLAIPPQPGELTSPLVSRISGTTYELDRNEQNVEWLRLDFDERGCTIISRDADGEHTLSCGSGFYRQSALKDPRGSKRNCVASGAWISEDAYRIRLVLYETPFCPTITARFTGDRLTYEFEPNVSFGPDAQPALKGRASLS